MAPGKWVTNLEYIRCQLQQFRNIDWQSHLNCSLFAANLKKQSRSAEAGITFPVGRVHRHLRKGKAHATNHCIVVNAMEQPMIRY